MAWVLHDEGANWVGHPFAPAEEFSTIVPYTRWGHAGSCVAPRFERSGAFLDYSRNVTAILSARGCIR